MRRSSKGIAWAQQGQGSRGRSCHAGGGRTGPYVCNITYVYIIYYYILYDIIRIDLHNVE